MGGASPLQQANPAEQRYARQPQTTAVTVQGGPFILHSRESETLQYQVTGIKMGNVISQPLTPVAGFAKWLDIRVCASGGVLDSATTATLAKDGPWSAISNVLFRDSFSNPLHTYSGYELFLLNLFGGQTGFWNAQDPANLPSYDVSDVADDGSFCFRILIPFELFDAYCSIPMASQAAMPTLRLQTGTVGDIYDLAGGAGFTTDPTLEVSIYSRYWAIPLDDPNLEPPQNGSTSQWFAQPAATAIPSGGSTAVSLPPMGAWLHSLILEFRDSTNERNDAILPNDDQTLELWVDQVAEYIQEVGNLKDIMFKQYGVTRPDGVLVFTYRDSIATMGPISAVDTGTTWLPTNPGTLLQLRSSAWGSFPSQTPSQLTVLTGRTYALGGVPYTHLGQG